ncbi:MAG: DUF6538 domain-containing protein [Pseudomonadota bacterium]
MGIVNDRGRYYWVKRVPKRFAGLVLGQDGKPVTQVRQALHTDSAAEAQAKAAQVEAARIAEWEALAAGDSKSAYSHYQAARKLAQAHGFSYRPVEDLATDDTRAIIDRLLSLVENGNLTASDARIDAVLGAVPAVMPTLSQVKGEYYDLTKTRHLQKSESQLHRWRLPRDRAVKNFITVVEEDPPVDMITRAHALQFRAWWSERVEKGRKIESANKDFGHLSEIFGTWAKLTDHDIPNPFDGLRLEGKDVRNRPSFSRAWVADKLLAPGAFDALNDEARDVFMMLINTGLRPSEVTDAPVDDFHLDHNVPHFSVAAHGRELKVAHTARDIPLLGVSLEAARRIVARGGIQKYRHKANGWSALVNKYLANNDLKESPDHVIYSLRHYVEDALLAAKVDDRVRADILGHKYHRPSYGDGGALIGRRDALALIAL